MPMGDNIREEERAKVDGLRAVNLMLREQNRVLTEALDTIARGTEDRVPPYRCIDFAMARRIAQAALTATSATPAYPGVIISGTLKDATNQEGQHG